MTDTPRITAESDNERHLATALHALRKVTSGSTDDNRDRIRMYLDSIETETDRINAAHRAPVAGARCPAAHDDDRTPCGGPVAVTVLDRHNAGIEGCEHHGARLLASIDGARVYALPDAPEGAAIRVFKAADGIRPFCWYENAPRTRPESLSHAENRANGRADR